VTFAAANTLALQVGYGNVAGFLFNKGVMNPPAQPSDGGGSGSRADGVQINPITGTIQEESEPVEMTDEERERESEQLFVLFDRLERIGALPPDQNPVRRAIQQSSMNS
jgi:Guanine nucleotide exchange factor synembryn